MVRPDRAETRSADSVVSPAHVRALAPDLARFDEDSPRPVPPARAPGRRDPQPPRGRDASPARARRLPRGIASRRSRRLRKFALEEACEVIDAIDSRRSQRAPRRARRPAPAGGLPGRARATRERAFAIDDVVAGHRRQARPAAIRTCSATISDAETRRRGASATGRRSRRRRRRIAASSRAFPGACRRSSGRRADRREGPAGRLRLGRRARVTARR